MFWLETDNLKVNLGQKAQGLLFEANQRTGCSVDHAEHHLPKYDDHERRRALDIVLDIKSWNVTLLSTS